MGKTCIFTFAGGPAPPRVAELGPDVRRGDKLLAEHGFVASGMPIGTDEYTQAWGTDHLDMEEALLSAFCDTCRKFLQLAMCLAPPVLVCCTPCKPRAPHDPPDTR